MTPVGPSNVRRYMTYIIMVTGQKPPGQKSPDNKSPRIIEEIIAKYAVDANLLGLGSTNLEKKSSPWFFLGFYTGGFLT